MRIIENIIDGVKELWWGLFFPFLVLAIGLFIYWQTGGFDVPTPIPTREEQLQSQLDEANDRIEKAKESTYSDYDSQSGALEDLQSVY